MSRQIETSNKVCQTQCWSGVTHWLKHSLLFGILTVSGLALIGPSHAQVQAPTHVLVNWPGALAYSKFDQTGPVLRLPAGQQVELLERTGTWWKIRHGDKEGWVNRFFLEPTTEAEKIPEIPEPPAAPLASEAPVVSEQAVNPDAVDSANADASSPLPIQAESAPDSEAVTSDFQKSMFDLNAVWKSRLEARANTSDSTGRFTAQLMKNSKMAWAPQVIASSRLVIGKDNFKLWVKTSKDGYVYVWSEAEDGELTLVFPNQRDADNQVSSGQLLYLPRKNWPIKSTGPAGQARLFVMVSELPRALPPPASLMEEVSTAVPPPTMPSVVGHELLKRHPFWMSTRNTLAANPALSYFLNPDFDGENCNPKKPQCSNTYGVKSVKLMKVEPEP